MRHDEPATMMHLIRPILLLVIVGALLLIAVQAKSDSLRVLDVAGSDGPEVLLSHVAELDGDHAEQWAAVVVGRFAEGESRVEIKTSTILEAIRAAGAKLGLLDLSGFTKVVVHRTFTGAATEVKSQETSTPVANVEASVRGKSLTVYTPTTVQGLIEEALAKRLGMSAHQLKVTFNDRDRRLLKQSAVAGRYEVEPIAEPALGAVSFKITAYHGTQVAGQSETVSARVQKRVIAVVAGEVINRGELIHRRQMRLREVLIDDEEQACLSDTSLIAGQVADRTIKAGQLITASSIKRPVAVKRRQQIAIELNHGGIKITFNGIAQEQGAVGEAIEVFNPKTKQRFTGTIVGPGKVVAGEVIQSKKEEK